MQPPAESDFPGHQGAIYMQADDGSPELVNTVSGKRTGRTFTGTGSSTDIVVASAQAYLGAINKMIEQDERARGPA